VSDPIEQGYNLVVGVPSVEDYCRLRVSAGLSAKSAEAAAAGLPNTLFGVLVFKEKKVIGMGRVVGDNGLFYQVVDIAVEPAHQRRGLGKAIVGKIVGHLNRSAPAGAHVSLIADGLAQHLYAQFGFKPTAPDSIGMAFTIKR
jgi:ribosomal protein S18 acetylase RimI-like enzyme